jgi:hypothetical protein
MQREKVTTEMDTTTMEFEIFEEEPTFRQAPGRVKSPLRKAMEELPVGKSMTTGLVVSGENPTTKDDRNILAAVRQKAQEINRVKGMRGMFSVRIDIENRVIVSRNEGSVNYLLTKENKTKEDA